MSLEKKTRASTYIGSTESTCHECFRLVKTKIVSEGGMVYFKKYCPDHGHFTALVSEDVDYYLSSKDYCQPGTIPRRFSTKVNKGCPSDCGLCLDHEQHTCHPIVEVTDHCNISCPICIADNKYSNSYLSVEKFSSIVDNLIACEGAVENITLSGGEPSLHPEFWELVKAAKRPEVARVSLVTNGIRMAEDDEFCRKLKEHDVYVLLQWDGFDDSVYEKLRGRPLMALKEKVLERIKKYSLLTQLIFVAARGVNEDHIGRAVQLMLDTESILSLSFQPLTFSTPTHPGANAGDAARSSIYDPMDRLTVPGVIKALAAQTKGSIGLKVDDFFPLPCSNPECISLTYLLKLDGGSYVPFPRFADMKKYLNLLSRSATIEPGVETETAIHEIITDLWSASGEVPDCERITGALKRSAKAMFDTSAGSGQEAMRAAERQAKSIFIHHYMDRYNFDLSRVIKCCHHYPRSDKRIMPICTFNLFHRIKEANHFDS